MVTSPVVMTPAMAENARKKAFSQRLRSESLQLAFNALPANVQSEVWNFLESSLTNGELTLIASTYSATAVEHALEMITAGINGSAISFTLFFKYPVGSNYEVSYPELTYIAKEFVPTLKNDNQLIQIINSLTGMSTLEIKKNLTWGYGAEINVVQLGNDNDGRPYKGKFSPSNPDKIFIDVDLVQQFENMPENEARGLIRRFITYSVLIHELVHFADYDVDQIMSSQELGEVFEEIYGQGWILEFILDNNGNETGEIG